VVPIFKDYDQSQAVFRDIHLNELLEEDHPARVIDRVVELLDAEELYGEYAEEGKPAYHPKMMLKVLFYS
jgi:transposase